MTLLALGLGSNMGDRRAMLRSAVATIEKILTAPTRSQLYETPALLPEGAPADWNRPFLNMVMVGETLLSPLEILEKTQILEQQLGRMARGHWAPREIDIDLLLYGDIQMQTPSLTLPHPHLLNRAFVLWPLAELCPEWQAAAEKFPPPTCVGAL